LLRQNLLDDMEAAFGCLVYDDRVVGFIQGLVDEVLLVVLKDVDRYFGSF